MRVVFDSNIFVICTNPYSEYYGIFKKLVRGDYTLCVTTEIIFEYIEIFQRKFNKNKAKDLHNYLLESPFVIISEIFFKWDVIESDPDDNKYVDCYIASNADYLVTNGKHFGILSENDFPPVKCINIDEFLKILSN